MVSLPEVPTSLKAIAHYLKTATEHDSRDQVVAYYCRLYALQMGLKLSSHKPEETQLLVAIMDWLETTKKASTNDSITQEVAGQAYLENYALKLFTYADKQDRESNFGKNVVKAFYTAGILYDVMTTFGEPTEEVLQNRKYAKWKAAYIHKCLKEGETPIPGPMAGGGGEEEGEGGENDEGATGYNPPQQPPAAGPSMGFTAASGYDPIPPPDANTTPIAPPGGGAAGGFDINPDQLPTPPSEPTKPPGGFKPYVPPANAPVETYELPAAVASNVSLTLEQTTKAQKYCKFASNSLNFGDLKSAVENLHKALRLIQTGQES